MYQQKICYVDLYKNGLKCGNMGHVRTEWKDRQFRVQAYLCHLDRQTLATAILEKKTKTNAMSMLEQRANTIKNGVRLKDIEIIHGKGVYFSDWIPIQGTEERLVFEASGGVCGICHLPQMETMLVSPEPVVIPEGMPVTTPVIVPAAEPENAPVTEEKKVEPEITPVPATTPQPEIMPDPTTTPQPEITPDPVITPQPEITPSPVIMPGPASPVQSPMTIIGQSQSGMWRPQELRETKWEQLCSMFPKISPIAGDIEFLQITPMDFVILRQEYQGLIRNSFLLHGYYNYNHIILGKYPDKYYIGVPGIMHEQERLAAAMFGFIGFEKACDLKEERKRDSENEVFGYYMMEVGI